MQTTLPDSRSSSDAFKITDASAQSVLDRLNTSSDGLSWAEANRRIEEHGPNIAVPHKAPAWYRVLWLSFNNPFNYVLLFLGIVSYLTDDLRGTIVMGVMIASATLLRFGQEYRSLVKAESLRNLVRNKCSVLRWGEELVERQPDPLDANASEVLIEELAPGDIVNLSAGDMIPADVRLLDSRDLFVSQSVLTGEAMPVEKMAASPAQPAQREAHSGFDAPELCFMGSSVVSGRARAVVVATGRTPKWASSEKSSSPSVRRLPSTAA